MDTIAPVGHSMNSTFTPSKRSMAYSQYKWFNIKKHIVINTIITITI